MTISPSICIDLGAAFTKIAIRSRPNDTSILLGDPGQPGDYQICIPSLALHRISTNSWLFGWELLDFDPKAFMKSEDMNIYQNWKSNLFPTAALDSDELHQKAITCCREFLTALGQELVPLLINLHPQFQSLKVEDFQTQICVPEFVLDSPTGSLIEQIMKEAGFCNSGSFCVSEPKSNLIGILTEGQNFINEDGSPNITYMFREFDLLERLTAEEDSVLFLDIGAFTTDLALTNLGGTAKEDLGESPAASFPLGIFTLDEMVTSALGPDFIELIESSEASFRENFHQIAYNAKERGSIVLRDGTKLKSAVIGKCIDEYTNSIIQACQEFLETHRKGNIEIAVLTGGGTVCSRISSRIATRLKEFDIKVVRAHQDANVKNLDPISRELVRGSSAIGGTSVLYALK